jgi:hypothetical protein
MMFEVCVYTYEEGGRVLVNGVLDFEDTMSRLYCHGLGDQIGKFVLSVFKDGQESWEFSYDPWTISICVAGGWDDGDT